MGLFTYGMAGAKTEEQEFSTGKYVGIQLHLGQQWSKLGAVTAETLLHWMDANEVSQACVLPLINPESWFYPITPARVLEQTQPYRNRLIPFCSVDPRLVDLGGYGGIVDILKRYVDAGAKIFANTSRAWQSTIHATWMCFAPVVTSVYQLFSFGPHPQHG